MSSQDLGPLAARVPEALRGASAYHVPQPPRLIAKLDANELPYGFPAEMKTSLATALTDVALERYPDPTAAKLRAKLATYLGVDANGITFGNGSDELISMLASAFAGPLLYPAPTFVYYKLAAVARGLTTVEVPLNARFEMDEAALIERNETHKPTVVFLALPNNPTGTLWRPSIATELAARFRDTVIVSDEAYFAYSGETNLPHLAQHPNLVVMRTLSKIGLAGLRVGFTIASRAVAALLEKVRPPYNVSSLDQRAAEWALDHAMGWCDARAAEVVAQRAVLATELAAFGEVFASSANLLLMRVANASETYAKLFAAGIAVRAFPPRGSLANCLRVTVGTPSENAALLSALRT